MKRLTAAAATALLAPCAAASGPLAYTVSDARFNGNNHLLRVDLSTGTTEDLGVIAFDAIEALALDDTGKLYGVQGGLNTSAWLVNLTTLPGVAIGRGSSNWVVFDHPGLFYDKVAKRLWETRAEAAGVGDPANGVGVPGGTTAIFRRVPTTAAFDRTFVAGVAIGWFADSFAMDPKGRAFAADFANTGNLYAVNLSNGSHTTIGDIGIADVGGFSDISFDAAGRLWALSGSGRISIINTRTAVATPVATIDRPGQLWTTLAVIPGPPCYGDYNSDAFVDAIDLDQFIIDWLALSPSSDINNDTFVDAIDYDIFVASFVAGC